MYGNGQVWICYNNVIHTPAIQIPLYLPLILRRSRKEKDSHQEKGKNSRKGDMIGEGGGKIENKKNL